MKKLVWRTVQKKVNELVPQDVNPRVITDKQMSDLKKSIKQMGFVEIPAIDLDGRILAGHQRVKALQLLGRGEEIIDVRQPNRKLTEEEAKRYLIASNAISGDWDFDLLRENFTPDLLTDIGFDPNILADIWDNGLETKEEDFDEIKELQAIKEPKTKLGDIVALGKHRLICQDSNDPEVIKKLFGEEKTSFVYQDPIYNLHVKNLYSSGLGGRQNFGVNVSDDRTDDEYIEFLRKNISSALTVVNPDCHIFYWNTEQNIWILQTLYREFGISNKRVCLWIKNGHNCTPQVAFNKTYEPCIYGSIGHPYLSKKEQGLTEILNRDITTGNDALNDINIWTAKRVSAKDYEHATTKPADLHHKPILRCTKPGDIILDSFGGSGSTLIAAEQLKRRAYLVELEPVFCDLIIRRYEALTGNKAKIIGRYEKR